jgi:hypothetical protein
MTDPMSTYLAFHDRWNKRRWGVASNMTAGAAAALDGEQGGL